MSVKLEMKNGRYELVMREKPASTGKRCNVQGCGGKPRGGKHGFICSRCLMLRWRANNPKRAAWNWLHRSAQKRDIPVKITFEQFVAWGDKHGYFDRKGRQKWNLTIERKDSTRGYELDNMEVLIMSANAAKGASEKANAHIRRHLQAKGVAEQYMPKFEPEQPLEELPDDDNEPF